MPKWKKILFLGDLTERKSREQSVVSECFRTPPGYAAHTWVQIQADKKVNNHPRIPSLGHRCPRKDHCSLMKIILFWQYSAPQFEWSPSTQQFSCPLPLQSLEKADTLLPPTPLSCCFLTEFVLKSDHCTAKVYEIYANHSPVTVFPSLLEFQLSVFGIRNRLSSTMLPMLL